jgi:hypothetical protein
MKTISCLSLSFVIFISTLSNLKSIIKKNEIILIIRIFLLNHIVYA